MEAICRTLAAEAQGGSSPRDWMDAWRELRALGWAQDRTKPEVCPHRIRRGEDPIRYKWYIDPVTGESHQGLRACFQVAFDRYMGKLELFS